MVQIQAISDLGANLDPTFFDYPYTNLAYQNCGFEW